MPQYAKKLGRPLAVKPGERLIISGRTGYGKTTTAVYLLASSPWQHWAVLNPKHTAGYDVLPGHVIMHRFDAQKFDRLIKEKRFVILNLSDDEASQEYMDSLVKYLHDTYNNIGLCVDELYTLHNNGVAGPGLTGWLTRGRERKQSFLGLTQRPVFVSKFVYSETTANIVMDLQLESDRKKMREYTGSNRTMGRLERYLWRWYDGSSDKTELFGPVPLLSRST